MDEKNPLKYAWKLLGFLGYMLRQTRWKNGRLGVKQGLEDFTGKVTYELWRYRYSWACRPRFGGFLKERECGCTYRFGRPVYIAWRCPTHSPRFFRDTEHKPQA